MRQLVNLFSTPLPCPSHANIEAHLQSPPPCQVRWRPALHQLPALQGGVRVRPVPRAPRARQGATHPLGCWGAQAAQVRVPQGRRRLRRVRGRPVSGALLKRATAYESVSATVRVQWFLGTRWDLGEHGVFWEADSPRFRSVLTEVCVVEHKFQARSSLSTYVLRLGLGPGAGAHRAPLDDRNLFS